MDGQSSISLQIVDEISNYFDGSNASVRKTITEWLANNYTESHAQPVLSDPGTDLRYIDYLTRYIWDLPTKSRVRRRSKRMPTVGRLTYIHPTCGELFYLRMLLGYQRGCCTYADIRTVSGVVLPTFRAACEKLGLIGDYKEWSTTIVEASEWATSTEMRSLFVSILLFCDVANPVTLWNENWQKIREDFLYRSDHALRDLSCVVNIEDLKQYVLYELELILNSNAIPRLRDNPQRENRVIVDYIGTLQQMQDKCKKDGSPYVTMKLKDCRKLQLQSTSATHLYISQPVCRGGAPTTRPVPGAGNTSGRSNYKHTYWHQDKTSVLNNNVTISELMVKNRDDLSGQIFAPKAAIIDLPVFSDWHHIGCPNCSQNLLKARDHWFCSMHGNYDTTPHM